MKHLYAIIFLRIFFTNLPRSVFAAVVNQQQLEVGEGLGKDAVDAARKILLHVVNRDDYGNFWIVGCNGFNLKCLIRMCIEVLYGIPINQ